MPSGIIRGRFLNERNQGTPKHTSMRKFFTSLAMLSICCVTGLAQVIYSTDFATQEEFNTWSVFDVNADGSTWNFDSSASPSFVFYTYNSSNAADDWMISPAITPTESGTAVLKFKVKGSSYLEKLQVFKGNAASPDGMTALGEVLTLGEAETSHVYLVNVTANETFHLGFKACSDADKWRLYLCNVTMQLSSNPVDLCVTEVVAPQSDFNLGNETVKIKVKNSGQVAVETFNVTFSVNDTPVATETVNQTLGIGEEMEYTFSATADLSTPRASFTIKAWTEHADDINNDNNTAETTVLHKAPGTVPYKMGFEADEYTDGITFFNLNEDEGDWTVYSDPWWNIARTGNYCLAYNYDKNNNGDDWAILEPITISEAGYYVLKFWYSGDDTHPEKLGVYYGNEASPEAMTNEIVTYAPFARSAYEESINIIYLDQPQTIYIGFHAFSDKDENWLCVDDVSLERIQSDDIDVAVTGINYPGEYVRNGANKVISYSLRNYGISDVEATCKVKIGENVVSEQPVTIKAQEILTQEIEGALANLTEGVYNITIEVVAADDKTQDNNTISQDFRVLGTPTKLWDFEDGQLPTDFTFRAEDEGTINPSAGSEFNEAGWGIFEIQQHPEFGEYMLAGTSWLDGTDQADRWCILPPFTPNETSFLVWDAASFNSTFLETYAIMISTNGDDSWYYFTEEEYALESANFKTRGIELVEYAGKETYIAFRLRSKNGENLVLDNIGLYGGELSSIDEITTQTVGINVSEDVITVTGTEVSDITVIDVNGRIIATAAGNEVSTKGLGSGVYVVRATTAAGTVTQKFVKK